MMNTDTHAEAPQEWKKKKGFFPTIVGASLFGLALLSTGQVSTVDNNNEGQMNVIRSSRVQTHDNYVTFSESTIEFDLKGHDISSGQPYTGVSVSGDTMDVVAGRHGSSEPAAAFSVGLSSSNVFGLDVKHEHRTSFPQDLNFFVYGTMTFVIDSTPYTCLDFRIGQGHHDSDNNWWVASSECVSKNHDHFLCTCGRTGKNEYAIEIFPGDDDHTFIVKHFQ